MGILKHLLSFVVIAITFFAIPAGILAKDKKVGLVLSGGGARGFAHIGVLKVLERNRVPISCVTGTSIGSIMGGLYASGYTAAEIEKAFVKADWMDIILRDRPSRLNAPLRLKSEHEKYLFNFEIGLEKGRVKLPPAIVFGQKLGAFLRELTFPVIDIRDFKKLPLPFTTVATDLESGEMVILDKGNLADAMRASSSYPGVLSPVEIDGRILTDGGMTNNLPVDLVRKLCADEVVAVDVSSYLTARSSLSTFFDISDQSVTILLRKSTQEQRDKADILMIPKLEDEKTFYLESIEQLIQLGEESTQKYSEQLKRLSVSPEAYAQWRASLKSPEVKKRLVKSIEIEGLQRIDPNFAEARLALKPNHEYSFQEIQHQSEHIYATDDFERVDFDLIGERLIYRGLEKRWGPHYLRLNATWDGEIKGKQDGNATLNYRFSPMNRLGAELYTDVTVGTNLGLRTEIYQPLSFQGPLFIAPQFSVGRSDLDFYSGSDRVADYQIDTIAGQIDLGLQLFNDLEIRGGFRKGFLSSEVELGDPSIVTFDVQTGALIAQLTYDTLNSAYFPKRGIYLRSWYYTAQEWLAADQHYRKLYGQLGAFGSLGHNIFFLQAEAGTSLSTTPPLYDEFYLGGFRSLSGFREEELRGRHFGVGRVGYLYEIPAPPLFIWDRMFFGGWFEAGNIWNAKSDVNIDNLETAGTFALGFDTRVGAVFLAYGQSGKDDIQFYVSVGRTFGLDRRKFY